MLGRVGKTECVWQQFGPEEWSFGPMVRGVVRQSVASVMLARHYEPATTANGISVMKFAWAWGVMGGDLHGEAKTFAEAIKAAEKALGIDPEA